MRRYDGRSKGRAVRIAVSVGASCSLEASFAGALEGEFTCWLKLPLVKCTLLLYTTGSQLTLLRILKH